MNVRYGNHGRKAGRVAAALMAIVMLVLLIAPMQQSFAAIQEFSITVIGGRAAAGPNEEPLTTVTLVDGKPYLFFVYADTSDVFREFDHWEAEGATLTDYQTYSSCFTMAMPPNDLTLTAVFRDTEANKRLAGPNRYATSQAVSDDYMRWRREGYFDKVVVASGDDFPDALAGSYLASNLNAPLLMVNGNNSQNVANYIRSHTYPSATVYILGGTGAVPRSFEDLITGSGYNFKAVRLAGSNRYLTNIEILNAGGACRNGYEEDIMVCSGKDFADALSASPLESPILLVADSLIPEQIAILQRPNAGNIYIMGGTGAVSEAVEQQIVEATGKTPIRLAGSNRYETSAAIAAYFSDTADWFADDAVFFASGSNFPDGLAGGPLASLYSAPLILIDKNRTAAAQYFIGDHQEITHSVTLGGTGVLPDSTVEAAMTPLYGEGIPVAQ